MVFPKAHLLSVPHTDDAVVSAEHLCTYISDTHSSSNGNLVTLGGTSSLVGVFLGNETGDLHRLSTAGSQPCALLGAQRSASAAAQTTQKWMEVVDVGTHSGDGDIAERKLFYAPQRLDDVVVNPRGRPQLRVARVSGGL